MALTAVSSHDGGFHRREPQIPERRLPEMRASCLSCASGLEDMKAEESRWKSICAGKTSIADAMVVATGRSASAMSGRSPTG